MKTKSKKKTYSINLTRMELIHLRDLFGMLLPPEADTTVSQALAALAERPIAEAKLWQKIVEALGEANITVGDDAPDFVVSVSAQPKIGVFSLSDDCGDSTPPQTQEVSEEEMFASMISSMSPEQIKQFQQQMPRDIFQEALENREPEESKKKIKKSKNNPSKDKKDD